MSGAEDFVMVSVGVEEVERALERFDLARAYMSACDRLAAGTGKRADVQTIASFMRLRGFDKIELRIFRTVKLPRKGTVKMLGRGGGPISRVDSKLTSAGHHLVAGWWDLDQIDYWLATHPAGGQS